MNRFSTAGLQPWVAPRVRTLVDTLTGLGYRAVVTSTLRDSAKQAALFAAWRAGKSRYPAAAPGTSSHEYGVAVDVWTDAPDQAKRFAASVAGLAWFGPTDRVHYDAIGGPTAWRTLVKRFSASRELGRRQLQAALRRSP